MHQLRLATDHAMPLPQAKSLGEVSELLAKLSAELNGARAELERAAAAAVPPQIPAPSHNQNFETDVKRAKALRSFRRNLLGDLYSGPPFEILLHLYETHLRQLKESITSLTEGAGLALTTTMRWTERLEGEGLIVIEVDKFDARRRYVQLSTAGSDLMNKYFLGASTHLIAA
jgi:DNA-binding MarR family transcriptional regulator